MLTPLFFFFVHFDWQQAALVWYFSWCWDWIATQLEKMTKKIRDLTLKKDLLNYSYFTNFVRCSTLVNLRYHCNALHSETVLLTKYPVSNKSPKTGLNRRTNLNHKPRNTPVSNKWLLCCVVKPMFEEKWRRTCVTLSFGEHGAFRVDRPSRVL